MITMKPLMRAFETIAMIVSIIFEAFITINVLFIVHDNNETINESI